jgi:hypothetical protein
MDKITETNIGDKGGLLVGKPHNDANGNPIGGIKAIVTDTDQIVEVEGKEAVINPEASKEHWRELSKINQSVGNGVPIEPPVDSSDAKPNKNGKKNPKDVVITGKNGLVKLKGGSVIINKKATAKHFKKLSKINQSAGDGVEIKNPNDIEADVDEYKYGGRTIEFNPNHLPSKFILAYATRLKNEYPKIWELGGNEFGNEAFKNLERVSNRGHWLDGEEWFYVKWQSFNARHKGDFRIAGVIANLKWLNRVDKGWKYMKDLIEKEIKKRGLVKMKLGGELGKGIEVEKEHTDTIQKIYDHKIKPEDAPKEIAKDHLEEMDNYYTELAKMEGLKDGGKIAIVMKEFKDGTLKTSHGEKVTDEKQAIAIALSEQRAHEKKMELGGGVDDFERIMKKDGDEDVVSLGSIPFVTKEKEGSIKELRDNARLFLKSNFASKTIHNKHLDLDVLFTSISINKLVHNSGDEKARALFHIKEIIEEAVPVSVEDISKHNNKLKTDSDFVYNMSTFIKIDNDLHEYSFKLFVKFNESKSEMKKLVIYSGHLSKENPI